jgi:hypothetical protein
MGFFGSYAEAFDAASQGQTTRSYHPDAATAAAYSRSSAWRRRAYQALRACERDTDETEEP